MEALTLLRVREEHSPFSPYLPENLRPLAARPEGVCVGAVFRGMACGAALAEYSQTGDWYLRYLFVDPAARRCGLGSYLLRGLLGLLRDMGAWRVTAVYTPSMLEERGQRLTVLERAGFAPARPMATSFWAPLGELKPTGLPLPEGVAVYTGAELPRWLEQTYQSWLDEGRLPPFADAGTMPGLSLLLSSFCAMRGELAGLLLVEERGMDLAVAGLYVAEGMRRGRTAAALMDKSLTEARRHRPPETEVWVSALNREAFALCDRLFGGRSAGRRETEMIAIWKREREEAP